MLNRKGSCLITDMWLLKDFSSNSLISILSIVIVYKNLKYTLRNTFSIKKLTLLKTKD